MNGGLTVQLAQRVSSYGSASIPRDIRAIAQHCVLDTIGVALVGVREPVCQILLRELREEGGSASASVIGTSDRLPACAAALINGTAAHALDYDDVHVAIPGHASAAVVPAVLALGQETGASGGDIVDAVVAGFEIGCRVGVLVSPGHYDAGFHATGTIGSIAVAAACARLLSLEPEATAHAIGIAVAQTAGLKSMVGTMCKPLHAGKAAYNGLLAARLASRGFTSRIDALECDQGFAETHSESFNPEDALRDPPDGFYLRSNIFKFHAACMLTHAPIEAARKIRERQRIPIEAIASATVRISRIAEQVCRYPKPMTSLEAKFSLPLTTALSLMGRRTGQPATFAEEVIAEPSIVALRDRIDVEYVDGWPMTQAEVIVRTVDGRFDADRHDTATPETDLTGLAERVRQKFMGLAPPIFGGVRAAELAHSIEMLDSLPNVRTVSRLLSPLT
jgi:2-methylcitrate dehydratase PrpD